MQNAIHTGDVPAGKRFDFWHDHISQVLAPVQVTSDSPENFLAKMCSTEFGAVHVSSLVVSSVESHRTPKLIRRSDPDTFQLALIRRGHNTVTQDRRESHQRASDMVLYHTSRPYHMQTVAEGETAHGIMVAFPCALLPFPTQKLERHTSITFSGREGIGALLFEFLNRLAADTRHYGAANATRLGTLTIDMLTALLAHEFETRDSIPPESHRRTMLLQIYAFIQRHLSDPGLSPTMIATAHNISIRYLHRLFQTQESTVAEWIRDRRLDRCRRDLTDPLLGDRPIHAVATRWGFPNPSNFTRIFRTVYGLAPQEYRRRHGPASTPGRLTGEEDCAAGTRPGQLTSSPDHQLCVDGRTPCADGQGPDGPVSVGLEHRL